MSALGGPGGVQAIKTQWFEGPGGPGRRPGEPKIDICEPSYVFGCLLVLGWGVEEPGGGLVGPWGSLGEALSTSLEGPRSHLGSVQETGGAEEWILLPL